jgi:carbon-monoxide dehydrogenase medium subunit
MYPASFEYHAPKTVAEALALLDKHQDGAKALSGGMSLVPLMKLRLAQPGHLVDLRKLPGMVGVWESAGVLQIGAMTTYRAIETDELVRKRIPAMSEAASNIGDAQVRNLGTIGGSLAHADPSADWPAVTTALDASVQIAGKKGERTVKIEDFIVGPLTTALGPGELLVQVRVPIPGARSGAAYEKYPHPASRFAVVGVAALLTLDAKGAVAAARVALTGLGSKPSRASALEKALTGQVPDAAVVQKAAAKVTDGVELRADLMGSADYKAQLAAVIAGRVLARAASRARGEKP